MADETDLWRRATRDVAPLPGRAAYPHPSPPPLAAEGSARGAQVGAATGVIPEAHKKPAVAATLPPLERRAGIDRATAERVQRGRYPVDAVLDLHGMTQVEAHRALSRMIAGSRAAGQRCLLVVTGHGRISGGILKAAVPRWLDEPELRHRVLLIAPARPQDGGTGALYVLLRRPERA